MLYEHKGEAKAIAGGTDLLVSMKQRVVTPRYLVDLATIPDLAYLSFDEKAGLRIGPLARSPPLLRTRTGPEVSGHCAGSGICRGMPAPAHGHRGRKYLPGHAVLVLPAVAVLAKEQGGVHQVQRRHLPHGACLKGLRGGLFRGYGPSTIALGAVISLVGHRGERMMPLSDLYTGDGNAYMKKEPDEIVREVSVPAPEPGGSSCYMKFRTRRAVDFPLVGVAANLVLKGGECTDARVVFNAVASAPVIAHDASGHLKGKSITPELIEEVSQKAYREAKPISSTGGCSRPIARR